MHRYLRPGLAVAAALLLAGCAGAHAAAPPSWVPTPNFNGEGGGGASAPTPTPPSSAAPSSGSPSGSAAPKTDPNVLATNLTAPVGLTLMPDGSALVGERTTGRIVRVQASPGHPVVTVRTIAGIDPAGDGGLLDLALSPSYTEDGLIFAYVTTASDNRVVDFTLTGPVTPVLTGIPKGASDNTGRLLFGPDGDLYVGTGDAGHPTLAAQPSSLAGKVLRITAIGHPAPGNPTPGSPVFTSGHHVVDGLCAAASSSTSSAGDSSVIEVEAKGSGGTNNVNVLAAGGSYGWPTPTSGSTKPAATLPAADSSPGGCAVLNGAVFVTSLDGQALVAAQLSTSGSTVTIAAFNSFVSKTYGRLRTVVAAPDGALWLTTSNRDGHGHPVSTDERVIRILPSQGGGAGSLPV